VKTLWNVATRKDDLFDIFKDGELLNSGLTLRLLEAQLYAHGIGDEDLLSVLQQLQKSGTATISIEAPIKFRQVERMLVPPKA
jgi:hypothetical protein